MEEGRISAGVVLKELEAIAMARATDVLRVRDGKLDIGDIQDLAAVASIEQTTGGLRVKFYDKLKALELLGKSLGLFSGEPEPEAPRQSTLLQALLAGTREEVSLSDLPEAQQAPKPCDDLVEPSGAS